MNCATIKTITLNTDRMPAQRASLAGDAAVLQKGDIIKAVVLAQDAGTVTLKSEGGMVFFARLNAGCPLSVNDEIEFIVTSQAQDRVVLQVLSVESEPKKAAPGALIQLGLENDQTAAKIHQIFKSMGRTPTAGIVARAVAMCNEHGIEPKTAVFFAANGKTLSLDSALAYTELANGATTGKALYELAELAASRAGENPDLNNTAAARGGLQPASLEADFAEAYTKPMQTDKAVLHFTEPKEFQAQSEPGAVAPAPNFKIPAGTPAPKLHHTPGIVTKPEPGHDAAALTQGANSGAEAPTQGPNLNGEAAAFSPNSAEALHSPQTTVLHGGTADFEPAALKPHQAVEHAPEQAPIPKEQPQTGVATGAVSRAEATESALKPGVALTGYGAPKPPAAEVLDAVWHGERATGASDSAQNASEPTGKALKALSGRLMALFLELDEKLDGKAIKNNTESVRSELMQLDSMRKSRALETEETVKGNISRTLNQDSLTRDLSNIVCLHIPVKAKNYDSAELYVYKRATPGKKVDPENTSLLIALNTENLGRVETLMKVEQRSVWLTFRLEDEHMIPLFEASAGELSKALKSLNYTVVQTRVAKLSERTTVANAEEVLATSMQRPSHGIDIKI